MTTATLPLPSIGQSTAQRGIALIVVMVILLLGTILVLGATRTTWLNESVVGSQSDYRRAYAAAEALIRDAEADIRGTLPGGGPINPGNPLFQEQSGRLMADPHYPYETNDLTLIEASIGAAVGAVAPCRRGICVPPSEATLGGAWWDVPATFAAMTAGAPNTPNAIAATYGEFTRINPLAAGNPLLLNGSAWYWVEILQARKDAEPGPGGLSVPDTKSKFARPFYFRITAIVQGQKPGTRVVLRTVFIPKPL